MLLEKLGNIKDMIMEQIEDFVLTKIITAGITWLISLLNPAAAFIKACKLIYDVVMFFVTNASRIAKFVNTVIDGVVDIAKGNVSAVVAKIEDALSQMVPILIGFIASVLGIGGIGEKIRSIIQKLQKPVMKAVDFVIKTGLKLAAPIIRGLKGVGAKAKAKIASGKAYVKGKVDAGKAFVKGKVEGVKSRLRPGKGKEGPASGQPPPKHDIHIKEPFSMNGAGHTLYADSAGKTLKIEMASRRQDLRFLLDQAGTEADALPKGSVMKLELKTELGKVKPPLKAADDLWAAGQEGKVKVTAAHDREINQLVIKAAGLLADVGRKFKLKSLERLGHASEWVTIGDELKSEFRGTNFRPKVYGGWNKANKTGGSFRNAEFDRLARMIPTPSVDFGKPDMFRCPECGETRLDVKDGRYEFTLDHDPSVISDWQGPGKNNSWDERNAFFNGVGSTLTGMCRACNSGLGGGNETPNDYKVGPKFRGKDEGSAP